GRSRTPLLSPPVRAREAGRGAALPPGCSAPTACEVTDAWLELCGAVRCAGTDGAGLVTGWRVVREGDDGALKNERRRFFIGFGSGLYRHLPEPGQLPESPSAVTRSEFARVAAVPVLLDTSREAAQPSTSGRPGAPRGAGRRCRSCSRSRSCGRRQGPWRGAGGLRGCARGECVRRVLCEGRFADAVHAVHAGRAASAGQDEHGRGGPAPPSTPASAGLRRRHEAGRPLAAVVSVSGGGGGLVRHVCGLGVCSRRTRPGNRCPVPVPPARSVRSGCCAARRPAGHAVGRCGRAGAFRDSVSLLTPGGP
ncbi:hypothetical protein GA0115246_106301, partial [Streptomyces sp. SolWspMP-sol7th]